MEYKSNSSGEDFKKRKAIARAGIRNIHFAEPWQWRVEIDANIPLFKKKIDGYHSVFDYLAKDVSFAPCELLTEPTDVGAAVFTYPKSSQPVVVTMTVRDTADRVLYNWFEAWRSQVVNDDGTFNLPATYVAPLTIYTYKDDLGSSEQVLWSGYVYPTKMGDIQMSVDGQGLTEFPIVFTQFASLGTHS